jgi:hypothetical protein
LSKRAISHAATMPISHAASNSPMQAMMALPAPT